MKAYTINLKRSIERRSHVNNQLSKIPFIDNEFIEGVDGSLLSEEELSQFDQNKAYKRYGRLLKLGEIGCTLSHRKCCERLLQSKHDAVIIFEDDIILRNDEERIWSSLYTTIQKETDPTIILLSGGYWSHGKTNKKDLSLQKIYSAYYTHSYIMNRAAATLILSHTSDYLADDWRLLKKRGLRLYGVKPHIVDQQWDGSVPSMIQNEAKQWFSSLPLKYKLKSYIKIIPCKILEIIRQHERDTFDNYSQI